MNSSLTQQIPEAPSNDTDETERGDVNNRLDDFLMQKLLNRAEEGFQTIVTPIGCMDNRKWYTKFKSSPSNGTILYITQVCILLIESKRLHENTDYTTSLWTLNFIVYSSVVAWGLMHELKGMMRKTGVNMKR